MQPCLGLSFAGFKLPWNGPCVEASQLSELQSKTSIKVLQVHCANLVLSGRFVVFIAFSSPIEGTQKISEQHGRHPCTAHAHRLHLVGGIMRYVGFC